MAWSQTSVLSKTCHFVSIYYLHDQYLFLYFVGCFCVCFLFILFSLPELHRSQFKAQLLVYDIFSE